MTTISDLLALPEGKTLEFKRDLSSLRPVLRTLVAFANTAAGTLESPSLPWIRHQNIAS